MRPTDMAFRFQTEYSARTDAWLFFLSEHKPTGERSIVKLGNLTVEPIEQGAILELDAALKLEDQTVQGLMDSLWQQGMRPSNGVASTGQLAATQKHLEEVSSDKKFLLDAVIAIAKKGNV
jgi:hypothetical protein